MQWYFRGSSQLPVAVQSWTLPPGGSEGMHRHPADAPVEELYLVVSGTVSMQVDDTVHELGPGDAVLAPVGADHDVRNTGDGTAALVVVWGEPGTAVDWARFGSGRAAHEADRRRTG
ncbi:MAG: cupin domain-containing protein [Pseudonocardia sp.]|nr:cupin domain-containing protein [Pseudonocardia sp.]